MKQDPYAHLSNVGIRYEPIDNMLVISRNSKIVEVEVNIARSYHDGDNRYGYRFEVYLLDKLVYASFSIRSLVEYLLELFNEDIPVDGYSDYSYVLLDALQLLKVVCYLRQPSNPKRPMLSPNLIDNICNHYNIDRY